MDWTFYIKKNFEFINILFNLHQKYAKIDLSIPFLLTENLGWYFIFRYCSDIQCALEPFHQFIQNSTQNINLSLNRTSEYNNSSLPLSFILYWNELWIHVIKLFYWNMKYLDVWKTKGGVIWSIHSFLEFRFLFLSILRTRKTEKLWAQSEKHELTVCDQKPSKTKWLKLHPASRRFYFWHQFMSKNWRMNLVGAHYIQISMLR